MFLAQLGALTKRGGGGGGGLFENTKHFPGVISCYGHQPESKNGDHFFTQLDQPKVSKVKLDGSAQRRLAFIQCNRDQALSGQSD